MAISSTHRTGGADEPRTSSTWKPIRLALRFDAPLVASIAVAVSITAFSFFYSRGVTNVYGDGIAHLNIARKIVDNPDSSFWRRYIQVGTPWLPLQTALSVPLVVNDRLWRNGAAGSLVSMVSFVIAAVAVFKIARRLYRNEINGVSRAAPFAAALTFALNPAVLYMQSTPMTELSFMASLSAAVLLLQRWGSRQTTARLVAAAAAMAVSTLSRYEAWPVAVAAALLVAFIAKDGMLARLKQAATFLSLAAIGPAYWLWHNWAIYGDAGAFIGGAHSARGIYLQNEANLGWSRIFVEHALPSLGLMLVTVAVCAGPLVLFFGLIGAVRLLAVRRLRLRENAFVLLLAVPFLFHVFSVYKGEIQVFPLSAFGLLNVRYGLPHLLASAVFAPAIIPTLRRFGPAVATIAMLFLVGLQYWLIVADGPLQIAVCQEGYRNGVNSKAAREHKAAASYLLNHPPVSNLFLHSGSLGPVISSGGLVYSRMIHEGTIRWHQIDRTVPGDVSTIIIEKGDPLDQRIHDNAGLAEDIARHFETKYSTESITILERASS